MRYLKWLLRVMLFLVLLGWAVRNEQPVPLRFYPGYEWQASLAVIMLSLLMLRGAGSGRIMERFTRATARSGCAHARIAAEKQTGSGGAADSF